VAATARVAYRQVLARYLVVRPDLGESGFYLSSNVR
jgi:hypothetical protein